ncbi:uncharacterized protein BN753_00062 [Clostridium sp. CAG:678]|nr:uncharacterized protein BN753_00062 [Clostridium sp. CAG:678]
MNITFLIGNGFDLNLGLETTYSAFLKEYTKKYLEKDSYELKNFKSDILADKELWSDAERAFGEYTTKFSSELGGEIFCDCHNDFCEGLAAYLINQESRIDYTNSEIKLKDGFVKSLSRINTGFREEQRQQIEESMLNIGGGFRYNFIDFNYTYTLDKCIELAKKSDLGKRLFKGSNYVNSIGDLYHVHGYVDKDMVLGVNDESQIGKIEIFSKLPSEYLAQIIKIKTNQMNEQHIDEKCHDLLKKSDLIYIYGMSTGDTDKLWWKRICEIMKNNKNLRVIIHKFDAPKDSLIRRKIVTYENSTKKEFINYCNFDNNTKQDIAERIHIDRTNIFSRLENIVKERSLVSA